MNLARAAGSHVEGTSFVTRWARTKGERWMWSVKSTMKYPSKPKFLAHVASTAHDPLWNPNIELNKPDGILPGTEHFWLKNSDICIIIIRPNALTLTLDDRRLINTIWVTYLLEVEDVGLIPGTFPLVAFHIHGYIFQRPETRDHQLPGLGLVELDQALLALAVFQPEIRRQIESFTQAGQSLLHYSITTHSTIPISYLLIQILIYI